MKRASVTGLLHAYQQGDSTAFDELASLLYADLKELAFRRSRGSSGMGKTTLLHETFLQLLSGGQLRSTDRRQFFALASTIMRRLMIDELRYMKAEKRSGQAITLVESLVDDGGAERIDFLLQVDHALGLLESEDEQLAKVFECRYFAGMTTKECAEALEMSERSVERYWSAGRARLGKLMELRSG